MSKLIFSFKQAKLNFSYFLYASVKIVDQEKVSERCQFEQAKETIYTEEINRFLSIIFLSDFFPSCSLRLTTFRNFIHPVYVGIQITHLLRYFFSLRKKEIRIPNTDLIRTYPSTFEISANIRAVALTSRRDLRAQFVRVRENIKIVGRRVRISGELSGRPLLMREFSRDTGRPYKSRPMYSVSGVREAKSPWVPPALCVGMSF